VRKDTPFPSVSNFVNAAMCIKGVFRRRKDGIKLRLPDIGSVAIDRFQGSV
jgi:hypothetical protein